MINLKATTLIILSISLLLSISSTSARLCQIENRESQLNTTLIRKLTGQDTVILYQCPRPEDPPHLTDCCYSGTLSSGTCCERKSQDFISGLDDRILIGISVGVIISCLLSSVLILICCFSSRCPLYLMCQSKYQHNDTIAFTTKEELMKLNGMPNEDYKIHQGYEPCAVKVRPVLTDA